MVMDDEEIYEAMRKMDDKQFALVWSMICENTSRCSCDTDKCVLASAPHDLMVRKLEKDGCACFNKCCGVCCGYCRCMYNGECDDYHEHCLDCEKWDNGNCPIYVEHKKMFGKEE